jgi:hypothetical protein
LKVGHVDPQWRHCCPAQAARARCDSIAALETNKPTVAALGRLLAWKPPPAPLTSLDKWQRVFEMGAAWRERAIPLLGDKRAVCEVDELRFVVEQAEVCCLQTELSWTCSSASLLRLWSRSKIVVHVAGGRCTALCRRPRRSANG